MRRSTRHPLPAAVAVVLVVLAAAADRAAAQSASSEWVVGGQGGMPWTSLAERWIALDDSVVAGAVQLRRMTDEQNVLRERVRLSAMIARNVFEYKWASARGRYGMALDTLLIGWHPRIWVGGAAEAIAERDLVDGDEFTYAYLLAPPSTTRPSAITWITLDLGVPLAIDSLVFMPPQNGFYTATQRFRDMYPQAYEVSRTNQLLDYLLFEDETASTGSSSYHALPEVVASTYSNDQSVVRIGMAPRFTRFLRLRLGGVSSTSILSEIKAFAQGYPQEGRYVSRPYSFGRAVSLGKVTWGFRKFRLATDGRIIEDPTAPVELSLRTRAGADADPNVYYVSDELGRQVSVAAADYYKAFAPRDSYEDGLPGFRGVLTDDIGNWNGWSTVYRNSGDEIRSSDGRRYLQFQFQITTSDPFAFGVLDSLAFEVSPLLADSVVAEVSLEGSGGRDARNEVLQGQDTTFVFDLKTAFAGAERPGFDVVDLDVPSGAQFVGLEVNGAPAAAGADFALEERPSGMRFAFPALIQATTAFRFRYRAALYTSSAFLGGQVRNSSSTAGMLPQAIESGNARDDVATNSTQVVAAATQLGVLGRVTVQPEVFTPNGDGANDLILVSVPVYGVESARLEVAVCDLRGRRVAVLRKGPASAGSFTAPWDGRGDDGTVVPPGVYLISTRLEVDRGEFTRVRPVAVAY